MKQLILLSVTACISLSFSACSGTHVATIDTAEVGLPQPNKAYNESAICIYRPWAYIGSAGNYDFKLDGKNFGSLRVGTWTYTICKAGKHSLDFDLEPLMSALGGNSLKKVKYHNSQQLVLEQKWGSPLYIDSPDFTIEPGEVKYFKAGTGFKTMMKLVEVSPSTGVKAIKSYKFATQSPTR